MSHVPPVGPATSGTGSRRLAGWSNVVAFPSVPASAPTCERPSNTQMEPTRPTVLCDPVTAARGSFATLG